MLLYCSTLGCYMYSTRFWKLHKNESSGLTRPKLSTGSFCKISNKQNKYRCHYSHRLTRISCFTTLYKFQVFYPGQDKPVFFVASRGHHADIGGITPGSMPPHSKYLHEEGAVFKSFKLVKGGVFQEEGWYW